MKKMISKMVLASSLVVMPMAVNAKSADGLNVIVNSASAQTQTMAMVLSMMSIVKHGKKVNITLCGVAGDLADKNTKPNMMKKPDGKEFSAKGLLQKLIKKGANVQVCPLYLPNAGKDKSILLKGITVAKPPVIAKGLLDTNYKNISF